MRSRELDDLRDVEYAGFEIAGFKGGSKGWTNHSGKLQAEAILILGTQQPVAVTIAVQPAQRCREAAPLFGEIDVAGLARLARY